MTTVLVPVKAFEQAKFRLSSALSPAERADLARDMATHVVKAAAPFPVAIVCDDDGVRQWAEDLGAEVVWCPGTGLNGAVQRGYEHLGAQGVDHVIVTHGDLPHAAGYEELRPWPGVTLVPDRHGSGTNVIAVSPSLGFEFSYGVGSFNRHVAEAVRLRQGMRIVRSASLGWDVDVPEDLLAEDLVPGDMGATGRPSS